MASPICCVAILFCGLSISSGTRAAMSSRVLNLCPCPRALCGAHWYPAARYAVDALSPLASALAKNAQAADISPQQKWLSALAECKSHDDPTIKVLDTDGYYSYGRFQFH